jgi:hypothetical protein
MIGFHCLACAQDDELPIRVSWELNGSQASFSLDSNEVIDSFLASRKAEKYLPEDCLWYPICPSQPFEVKDGDIVLVRAIGLQRCLTLFELEVRADNQYHYNQLRYDYSCPHTRYTNDLTLKHLLRRGIPSPACDGYAQVSAPFIYVSCSLCRYSSRTPVPKLTKEVGKKRKRNGGEGSRCSHKKLFVDLTKSDEAVAQEVIDLTNEE